MNAPKQCETCGHRVMWLSAGMNLGLASLKAFVGYITGSKALIADALHSGSDILCALLAIWSRRISGRPKDRKHPYGHGKIEFIVGFAVGIVMIFAASHILYRSLAVLFSNMEVVPPKFLAFWVALLSVYANFVISHLTMCAANSLSSPALKSISIDNRSDAYSSVPVVVCILGSRLGLPALDPLAAVFVGLLIFKMGAGLILENYHGLMDASAHPDQAAKIREIIASMAEVGKISYLRTRQTGQDICVDLEVCVEGKKTVDEAYSISRKVRSALKQGVRNIGCVQISLKPTA